jgi:hypothetical protein
MRLADYPLSVVRVACEKCGRAGQYRRATLIARFGSNIPLPDLRFEIASDCPRAAEPRLGTDACGIVYPDLWTRWKMDTEA